MYNLKTVSTKVPKTLAFLLLCGIIVVFADDISAQQQQRSDGIFRSVWSRLNEITSTFVDLLFEFSKAKTDKFDEYAAKTGLIDWGSQTHVIKTSIWDESIKTLGMGVKLPKFLLCLLLAYPLSYVFRLFDNGLTKNLWSILWGVVYLQWIYGSEWINPVFTIVVTYIICIVIPRKYTASFVMFFAMAYMILAHVYRMVHAHKDRQYIDPSSSEYLDSDRSFDFTGTQMVLTMKLSSFAYNYFDGKYNKDPSESEKWTSYDDRKRKMLMSTFNERKKYSINALPSLLNYLGYMLNFNCILAGPAFEYNDYIGAVDGTAFGLKAGDTVVVPSSSLFPSFSKFVVALACIGASHFGKVMLGFDKKCFQVTSDYGSDFAKSCNFARFGIFANSDIGYGFMRYAHTWIGLFFERLQFYFVWIVSEGSSILSGFGFEGDNKWGGVNNMDPIAFESADSVSKLSRVWNKRTQKWLERYTYHRTAQSLFITYLVSSMWHGLYPGFFMFFMSVPLYTSIERLVRQKINPRFIDAATGLYPLWYSITCILMTSLTINYIAQFFSMGSLAKVSEVSAMYKHSCHIFLVVVWLSLLLFPSHRASSDEVAKPTLAPSRTPSSSSSSSSSSVKATPMGNSTSSSNTPKAINATPTAAIAATTATPAAIGKPIPATKPTLATSSRGKSPAKGGKSPSKRK